MRRNLVLIVFLCLFYSYNADAQLKNINSNLFVIDRKQRYDEKHLILQDHTCKIEYIKLETSDNCLLGKEQNLQAIYATSSDLFIVDNNNIYRFERNGRFKNKISRVGQGPKEYSDLSSVLINESQQEVLIYDLGTNNLLFFNYQGDFIRNIKLPGLYKIGLVNGKILAGYSVDARSNLPALGLYEVSDGKLKSAMLNNRKTRSGILYELAPKYRVARCNRNQVYFNTHLSDTIFSISDELCTPRYVLHPSNKGKTTQENSSAVTPFLLCETDVFANIQVYGKNGGQNMVSYIIDKRSNKINKGFIVDANFSGAIFPFNSGVDNQVVSLYYTYELLSKLDRGLLFGKLKDLASELEEESNPILMITTINP